MRQPNPRRAHLDPYALGAAQKRELPPVQKTRLNLCFRSRGAVVSIGFDVWRLNSERLVAERTCRYRRAVACCASTPSCTDGAGAAWPETASARDFQLGVPLTESNMAGFGGHNRAGSIRVSGSSLRSEGDPG